MILFSFFTKLLHIFPGEIAHTIALKGLKVIYSIGLLNLVIDDIPQKTDTPINLNTKNMNNKLGIAAGLDKNAEYIDCLAALGIGFIELGTVTPRPQSGNPKPRLFRIKKEKALINRLGFNNKGVDYFVSKLKERKSNVIIGSSIGKNFDTPNDRAHEDYLHCFEKVYEYTDYIAINISSPNTKDLRELTHSQYLSKLIGKLKSKQQELSNLHGYKPIFLKISPDEDLNQLKKICNSIIENEIDGVICSNTSINHDHFDGQGGLSGAPLKERSTSCLRLVKSLVGDTIPIIASGGVMSVSDFEEKLEAGADYVQLYTGFIYEGPKLIKDIVNRCTK